MLICLQMHFQAAQWHYLGVMQGMRQLCTCLMSDACAACHMAQALWCNWGKPQTSWVLCFPWSHMLGWSVCSSLAGVHRNAAHASHCCQSTADWLGIHSTLTTANCAQRDINAWVMLCQLLLKLAIWCKMAATCCCCSSLSKHVTAAVDWPVQDPSTS